MTHLRIDSESNNDRRRFACGIGPELPAGDKYVFAAETPLHRMVDCPGCGGTARPIGTPISQLSGRPGHPGYARFCEIAASWGYE